MLKDKKVIIIGDRDGIPAGAMEDCIKAVGAEIIYSATQCFACSTAGSLDTSNQEAIIELSKKYISDSVIVVLGTSEAESTSICIETLAVGDPTGIGPLAGVALGMKAYHIFELKDEVESGTYGEQCGVMEMVLAVEKIVSAAATARMEFSNHR